MREKAWKRAKSIHLDHEQFNTDFPIPKQIIVEKLTGSNIAQEINNRVHVICRPRDQDGPVPIGALRATLESVRSDTGRTRGDRDCTQSEPRDPSQAG